MRSLLCDKITAYTACQAVTSALYLRVSARARARWWTYQCSMRAYFLCSPMASRTMHCLTRIRWPGGLLIDMVYDLTLTKDGGITVAAANQDMQGRMLKAIGLLSLLEDERFNTMKALMKNLAAFRDLVAQKCIGYTSDELTCITPRGRGALCQVSDEEGGAGASTAVCQR